MDKIVELIMTYSPIVVTVAGYISTFCILVKKLKGISFKKETSELETKVDTMINNNAILEQENRELKKQLSLIIDKNMKIINYEEKINDEKV